MTSRSEEMKAFLERQERVMARMMDLAEAGESSFSAVFPSEVVQAHSSFASLDEMLGESGVRATSWKDLEGDDGPAWDEFVREHTDFSSWDEMLREGGRVWYGKITEE